jgi:Fe-S-cluster containining protein
MQPLINSGLPPAMITLSKGLRVEPLSNGTIYICPLFNYAKNRCKVYSLRPLECQLYPFLINRRQETIFLAADLKCPFLEGKLDTPELKEYTLFLAGLLTSPPFAGVLRNNPQILQAYPDAVDLKEIKL